MSNNSGYIRTLNEWHFENIKLSGVLTGSGNQLTINKPNTGPVLQIGGNPSYHNDLFVVSKPNGEDVIRVNAEGTIWIDGGLHKQIIAKDDKGIMFLKDDTIYTKSDELSWDYTNNRLGVGTSIPTSKIHLKDGDLNIDNGVIKLDNMTHLNHKKLVLLATQGDSDPNQGIILGDPNKNGSWRIVVSAGHLHIEKRENGVWTMRQKIS